MIFRYSLVYNGSGTITGKGLKQSFRVLEVSPVTGDLLRVTQVTGYYETFTGVTQVATSDLANDFLLISRPLSTGCPQDRHADISIYELSLFCCTNNAL